MTPDAKGLMEISEIRSGSSGWLFALVLLLLLLVLPRWLVQYLLVIADRKHKPEGHSHTGQETKTQERNLPSYLANLGRVRCT